MPASPPDVRRWAAAALADLTDQQRSLVLACAASMIAGVAATEAPAPLLADVDMANHTVPTADGTARYIQPMLWQMLCALSDGGWHVAATLVEASGLHRAASMRENILRDRVARMGRGQSAGCKRR